MLDEQTWDDLRFALRKSKCILALGSGASTAPDREGAQRPITEQFALHLAGRIERENHILQGEPGNLLQTATQFIEVFSPTRLRSELDAFYTRFNTPGPLLEQLAGLPFHLVLTAAPDTLICKALEKAGKMPVNKGYTTDTGKRKEIIESLPKPTAGAPLVYNMLGAWHDSGSLILTEKNQLDFLQDIIRHNEAIPNALLELCRREECIFLFVGFDFERWQLRILLRTLQLNPENKIVHLSLHPPQAQLRQDTLFFFNSQYNVRFVGVDDAAFFSELTRRMQDGEQPEAPPAALRLRAVCLYADQDAVFRDELDAHLAPLREHKDIETWSEANILPGQEIEKAVTDAIDAAHIILILASADFVDNENLYRDSLTQAIARFKAKKAKIFVIVVRAFHWQDTLFEGLPFLLPQGANGVRPVSEWSNRDEAYTAVVKIVKTHVNYLLEDLTAV